MPPDFNAEGGAVGISPQYLMRDCYMYMVETAISTSMTDRQAVGRTDRQTVKQ